MNKSAASAASLDYLKFQAVIKSAASAASLVEAAIAADLITSFFFSHFSNYEENGGEIAFLGPYDLNTHAEKNTFSILLRKPRAQARARSPRAQAQGLRRRMENSNKRLEQFEKIVKK